MLPLKIIVFSQLFSIVIPAKFSFRECTYRHDKTRCIDPDYLSPGCGLPNRLPGGFHRRRKRIVGGRNSRPNEFPWIVNVQVKSGSKSWTPHCGGTLITNVHVLTAAQCISGKDPVDFRMVLGDHHLTEVDSSERTRLAKWIRTHPEYTPEPFVNDIGLIQMKEPVNFDEFVRPVCLPVQRARFHELDGQYAGTIGWGTTSYNGQRSMILQKVNLKIIPYGRCTGKETGYDRFSHVEPLDHICAGYLGIGGKDTCEGDGGAPLTVLDIRTQRHVLVGLSSFGSQCGRPRYPGVYTRVDHFIHWIVENTQDGCFCNMPKTTK